jgi:uncharacterized SAM-binding protein YcdF (DUF218 family)
VPYLQRVSVGDESLIKRFADLGGDPSRINMEPHSRTTSEDALYSAALLTPKSGERWLMGHPSHPYAAAAGCLR